MPDPGAGAPGVRAPLRVTQIVFDFSGGGMETLVAEMAARFAGTPVSVSLITLGGQMGRLGEQTRDRFDQFHVLRPVGGASMLVPLGIARAIRHTRPDVVHLHSGAWFKPAWAARLAGVPRVVYTEHGREHDDPSLMQFIDRRAAMFTTAVVAVSERLARYLATVVRIPAARICTIHNGVDTAVYAPGPPSGDVRARLDIPPDAIVIGSVGRLETVKAYDHLLEAAALLRPRLARPFVVALCGDGSQRDALQARARELGIADMVRLPGWTDQPVSFYRLLDLFVLSSRSEGQSVSLMEAMACGVVPVVTDVGSNAEMLGPDLRPHVVPAGQPGALANAIEAVLAPPERATAVRRLVRDRAVGLYSLERMVGRYEALYRGLPLPG